MTFQMRYNVLFRQFRLLAAQAGSIPAAIRLIFENCSRTAIFIQSGIKWLDRDFPQGKKACQTRTAQRTAIRTHCFSLKFRCFFDMIAPL